jgi:hypothetical protein
MANARKTTSGETSEGEGKTEVKAEQPAQLRIPLHDPVPSLFADGCHGANVIAGCVRLDLFVEHAWAGTKGTQQMVVGRVVVPIERFESFARATNLILKKLQDDKVAKAAGTAVKETGKE